jgi:hypothetical protein
MTQPGLTPAAQWAALKARGNYTRAEIDAIDAATPWSEVEPQWWLAMMAARNTIGMSVFAAGAKAFGDRLPLDACPYPDDGITGVDRRMWRNGWFDALDRSIPGHAVDVQQHG